MKSILSILLAAICGIFATSVAFAQTPQVVVWTNQYQAHLADVGDLNQATNWSPNSVPQPMTPTPDANGAYGDLTLFDGRTTGPLSLTQSGGVLGGGGGQSYPAGARIELTSNQVSSVTLYSVLAVSAGLRMNWFTIDSGAGALILGDHSGNCFDIVCGEQNGQPFGFTNYSTTPSIITEAVRWRCGGAGFHPMIFGGSGDWTINNHMRSANGSSIVVQMSGTGTLTWTGTNNANANYPDTMGTPMRVDNGTVILKSSDLMNAAAGSPNIVNNSLLVFDYSPAPGIITTPDTIRGNITGIGTNKFLTGTTTFAGASTFSGPWILLGGEAIAGSVESVGVSGPLGQNGIISFNGGTLGWNLNNAFDYSPRFDTTPGQVYNLDTGGASPTLATGLTSSGGVLNKTGGGTLTLAGANTYSGLTSVGANGQLLFQGTKSGSGNITIDDTGALGVFENGSQITPSVLTVGAAAGATLEFNNVTNHTVATLAPGTLVANGPITINVNSGRFRLINETFPLIKWTTGTPPEVVLGFLGGAGGHLVTNVNNVEIDLVIDDPPYIWTDLAADNIWNTTSIDWEYSGNNVAWVNGHYALLDDTAPNGNINFSGLISATNATINNTLAGVTYALNNTAGNKLTGPGSLTKNGNGTLTLPGGTNDYTGVTTIGGGVLTITTLANGGIASDIGAASSGRSNIVINGGTFQYNGPGISVDRLFSVGQNGGTVDSEGGAALVFNNAGPLGMSGNGPRTLTLTGPNAFGDTLASAITNHPAGTSVTKAGTGTWILTGTNTYAGGTAVQGGTLQIGNGGVSGRIGNGNISTVAGTIIDFELSSSNFVPGAISGGGALISGGTGTNVLANNSSYTGGTTINAGSTLWLGNGGGNGSLNSSGNILNDGTLVFNTSGTFNYGSGAAAGVISGAGNVIVQGGGFIKALGNHTYSGWTRIDANSTWQPVEGQDGALVGSSITNNGTLRLVRQDAIVNYPGVISGSGRLQIGANNINVGIVTLTASNFYTGGTFIGDNQLTLGDNSTPGSGAISGNVQFVNNFTIAQNNPRILDFNRVDDFTFGGTITTNFTTPQPGNIGIVQLDGSAIVTLTGNNTYGSGTIVNNGSLLIGNGGSSGSVGSGPITINNGNNGTPLIINRSGSLAIPGAVTGSGYDVVVIGGVTLTFSGANTYSGSTWVTNSSIFLNGSGVSASIYVTNGTLGGVGATFAPVTLDPKSTLYVASSAGPGNIGTLVISNDLTLNNSNFVFAVNRSVAVSNSSVLVSGTLSSTASQAFLIITNLGPNLRTGDRFVLFSQPLTNGLAVNVSGGRATWINDLATDGSVTVGTVSAPPVLNATRTGNTLQFSWSDSQSVFKLQYQTNATLTAGSVQPLTGWADYPGGGTSPVNVPINRTNVADAFFRIISVP